MFVASTISHCFESLGYITWLASVSERKHQGRRAFRCRFCSFSQPYSCWSASVHFLVNPPYLASRATRLNATFHGLSYEGLMQGPKHFGFIWSWKAPLSFLPRSRRVWGVWKCSQRLCPNDGPGPLAAFKGFPTYVTSFDCLDGIFQIIWSHQRKDFLCC